MKPQNKLEYVASGCITFIRSMAYQHCVPAQDLYELVSDLCGKEASRLASVNTTSNT